MGYEVLERTLQPLLPNFADRVRTTTNPNDTGKRPRINGKPPQHSPIILNYVVRKPITGSEKTGGVDQTDYQRKWQDG